MSSINHFVVIPAIPKRLEKLRFLVVLLVLFSIASPTNAGGSVTLERLAVASDGTPANKGSGHASVSADGRFVVFESNATNLVLNDTNSSWDIFVRHRQAGTTQIISIASDGTPADGSSRDPAISADGHYVVFETLASNLSPGGAPPGGEVLGSGVAFIPGLNIYLPLLERP